MMYHSVPVEYSMAKGAECYLTRVAVLEAADELSATHKQWTRDGSGSPAKFIVIMSRH